MKTVILLWVILILGIWESSSVPYDGYKMYRVDFVSGQEEKLKTIVYDIEGTEFWLFSLHNRIADIFTPPNVEKQLLKQLQSNGFSYYLINDDIQSLIDGTSVA